MAKRGTLEHPKTKRLARALDLPHWAALGLLEAVWHWVGRYCPTGELTQEDVFDCQDTVRFDGDLRKVLIDSGWLDLLDNGNCYVHDWHDHADDTVKKTLAKRSEQFANGSSVRKQNQSRPEQEPLANDSRTVRDPIATSQSHEPKPEPKPVTPKPPSGKSVPDFGGVACPVALEPKALEWQCYRRKAKLKPYTAPTWQKLFEKYEPDPALFGASVDHSISNGYQGVIEPKANDPPKPKTIVSEFHRIQDQRNQTHA